MPRKKNLYKIKKFLINFIPNKKLRHYFMSKMPLYKNLSYSKQELNVFKNLVAKLPNIYNPEETLNKIILENLSFSRIGDGEFNLTIKESNVFQQYSKILAQKLIQICCDGSNKNCLVCLNKYDINSPWFLYHGILYLDKILNVIKFKKDNYGDAYFLLGVISNNLKSIERIKKLWENKNIIFVCNKKSNIVDDKLNLFDKAIGKHYIFVPNQNAFDYYESIIRQISQFPVHYVVYCECGALASVLSYELSKKYRVFDMGDFYNRLLFLHNKK